MKTIFIGPDSLSFADYQLIASGTVHIALHEVAEQNILRSRKFLEEKTARSEKPIYGVNTGFGSLCNIEVNDADLGTLQTNLVRSHACGMGATVRPEIVRLMIALKLKSFSTGFSGVRLSVCHSLVKLYNSGALPVIYELGSLGASGDLAPLAHLSLPLLGEGELWWEGSVQPTTVVLASLGSKSWEVHTLASKEGLALLNGTQFMSAHGLWAILHSRRIDYLADSIAALSTAAHDGRIEPFTAGVHATRPQKGQVATAARMWNWLQESPIMHREKVHVQDPYSFRCVPQVHGASKNALWHVMDVVGTEIDAATDNPVVLEEEDAVLSAGNFHGQPLALVLDYLAIALAELGSISERRTYQLISGRRDLPPFLTPNPGLNSGLMIAQYTAAGIVSQNKQWATPASIDSIESSNGQEDHVSMGANAATKLVKVVDNLYRILGIELINAAQAATLRNAELGPHLSELLNGIREVVPALSDDRYLHPELLAAERYLRNTELDESQLLQ